MTIGLAAALDICRDAVAEAERLGALVSVAVADSGGHLVAFTRMDGAEIAGPVLAPDKAFTAVANRAATHELAALAAPGGPLFGLHSNGGGRFVIFGGGLPLHREGFAVRGGLAVSPAELDAFATRLSHAYGCCAARMALPSSATHGGAREAGRD